MKKKILAAMLAACVVTAIPAGIGTATSVGGYCPGGKREGHG